MKHLLLLFILLCSASIVRAQDVIVKKDGSTIVCRVVEVTATEITYKKWSDLNGSNYVMERSAASAINYENGKKVNLSEATNLYMPNNQNDGTQLYNDRALLAIDAMTNHNPYKKVKTLKTVGWIGGCALVSIGIASVIFESAHDDEGKNNTTNTIAGVACIAGGVAWTTTFQLIANSQKKKIDGLIQSSVLYHYDLMFSNGASLSLGTDFLRDNTLGQNALGLGLRYNF